MKRYIAATLYVALLIVLVPQGSAFADGGRLYLSAPEGVYTVGKPFTVSVLADTADTAVSAVEGELAYNPLDVSIENISTDNSILTLWSTEPSYNGANGTINFSGWAQNNYNGTRGLLVTLTLVPLRTGQVTLNFNSGAMLAADGKGSNIITSMTSGTYATQPKQVEAVVPVTAPSTSTPAIPENPPVLNTSTTTAPAPAGESNAAALPLSGVDATSTVAALLDAGVTEALPLAGFFGMLALIAFAVAYYFHRKKIAF